MEGYGTWYLKSLRKIKITAFPYIFHFKFQDFKCMNFKINVNYHDESENEKYVSFSFLNSYCCDDR